MKRSTRLGWIITLVLTCLISATATVFAFDDVFDDGTYCTSYGGQYIKCKWFSFYEYNGKKFVKSANGGVIGTEVLNAYNDAGNNWNSKTTTLKWLYVGGTDPAVKVLRAAGGDADTRKLGWAEVQHIQSTGELTFCTTYMNMTALNASGQTSYALKQYTATHEMGHCWGLNHSNVNPSIMRYGTIAQEEALKGMPQADDVLAIKARYSFE